jgi:hypothetical protein
MDSTKHLKTGKMDNPVMRVECDVEKNECGGQSKLLLDAMT